MYFSSLDSMLPSALPPPLLTVLPVIAVSPFLTRKFGTQRKWYYCLHKSFPLVLQHVVDKPV